jgi:hypothetical protein
MPMPINPIPPAFTNVAHGIGPSPKANAASSGKNASGIKYRPLEHTESGSKAGVPARFYRSGFKSIFYLPLPSDRRISRQASGRTAEVSPSLSPLSKAIYQANIANLPGAKRVLLTEQSALRETVRKMLKPRALASVAVTGMQG